MGGQGGRERIPGGWGGHGGPLAEEDRPGFLFPRCVGITGRVGGGNHEGGDQMWVEEGEQGAAF